MKSLRRRAPPDEVYVLAALADAVSRPRCPCRAGLVSMSTLYAIMVDCLATSRQISGAAPQ